jgi:transcription termination/antitermination protein NusA
MNFKEFLLAMQAIEGNRNITKEIVLSALQEALSKAYRKQIEIPDALVRVDIDQSTGEVKLFQEYLVVENVEDDELEIGLDDSRVKEAHLELGQHYSVEVNIDDLGRAAALLAKNVMKQKIREAEKQGVYDEYIDKLDEMVIGIIESVEEKFIVVNLGKTLAMMPKAAQIPNELYKEGQKIRLVITEVTKDTKGAQVLVSRADAKLVKRLFEKEVPEIFQGIVEIKAIAREAGERTKMAVHSKREDVDPIGACIGPRGSRVQVVIEELKGEKIDIFEWSENVIDLIKNSLSPAQILAVLPTEEKRGLLVVVDESQLSLAIGKKGKNARLAVRLTNLKIDIKSSQEMEEEGRNWKDEAAAFALEQQAKILERKAKKLQEEREKQAIIEAQKQAEYANLVEDLSSKDDVEEVEEKDFITEEIKVETKVEPVVKEKVAEPVKEVKIKAPKKPLEVHRDYVSKLEKLVEVKQPVEKKEIKRKKKSEEEERRLRASELVKDKDYEIKIEYTEEELAEIAKQQELEKSGWEDEVDYDEYEAFYEDEE